MNEPDSPDVQPFDAFYVEAAARILGVLRHPTRLHLVLLVAQGETHVSRLSELLDLPQSNVSHHLGLLRNVGLVADRREGQFVLYRLNTQAWQLLADGFFDRLLGGQDEVRLRNILVRREPEGEMEGEPDGDDAGSPERSGGGKEKRAGAGKGRSRKKARKGKKRKKPDNP